MSSAHTYSRAALAFRYAVLAIASLVSLTPLVYMLLTSLRENAYVLVSPADVVKGTKSLANYSQAWIDGDLAGYFVNSVVVAVATTTGVVALGSMMAYAFARFDFAGKSVLFGVVIACQMIPAIMLIIPQFILAKDLHVLNSRLGLVLFYIGTNLAFNTFLLRGFFEGIPRELDEAMVMDGAGAWRRYSRLILPLAKPALATGAIFSFLGSWDEYVWAVTIITDPGARTLPVGIAMFAGTHATNWGLTFAASTIALIPVLVVFLVFQRQFVSGIMSGAVKS
jgi:multiple sugar transport system permease protein